MQNDKRVLGQCSRWCDVSHHLGVCGQILFMSMAVWHDLMTHCIMMCWTKAFLITLRHLRCVIFGGREKYLGCC